MGIFIDVRLGEQARRDRALAARLCEVCPVNIFAQDSGGALSVVEENVDECTLCELCLAAGPAGCVEVRKLYDGGKPLGG